MMKSAHPERNLSTRPCIVMALCLLTVGSLLRPGVVAAADRPNVVWIVSEDNSKHYLQLFDPAGAATPNIAKLADHGLIFEHAFSNAPVCSVARTTLATCVYGPRIATQYHRRTKMATLPADWRMFPHYLREAGYYTTNNSKKDYNAVEGKGVWDESSRKATWRNRKDKTQPFFHMESHGVSHESSLHFNEKQWKSAKKPTDLDTVKVWPYFPDTPLFRFTHAYYLDRMRAVDKIVGNTVAKLKEDGLLEDTFVFYFGDHGGVMPASKGYAYERGLHVPLVVRVPEKWKHLVDFKQGSRVKGFVEFVDFGATALSLAGVDVPEHMDGKPFLGKGVTAKDVNARDEAFGYADRFDEKWDHVRTLRKGKYKYIRNYQAFYPDALQNNYRYRMLAYRQWRQMYNAGKLNAEQRQFFEARPAEALYDIEADPHELKNLAGDPKHAKALATLRARFTERVKSLPDLSMYPESVIFDDAAPAPHAFAMKHKQEIGELIDIADLAIKPFSEAKPGIKAALASKNRWHRYWGLIVCSIFGAEQAKDMISPAKALLKDEEPLVRVRAAEFLGAGRVMDPRPTLMDVLRTTDHGVVAALTLNTVVYLRDMPNGYAFDIKRGDVKARRNEVDRRLEYLNPKAAGAGAGATKPKGKGKKTKKP